MNEVPVVRRLERDVVSKHAKGRHPKMTDQAKRQRTRATRARISAWLDLKAMQNA